MNCIKNLHKDWQIRILDKCYEVYPFGNDCAFVYYRNIGIDKPKFVNCIDNITTDGVCECCDGVDEFRLCNTMSYAHVLLWDYKSEKIRYIRFFNHFFDNPYGGDTGISLFIDVPVDNMDIQNEEEHKIGFVTKTGRPITKKVYIPSNVCKKIADKISREKQTKPTSENKSALDVFINKYCDEFDPIEYPNIRVQYLKEKINRKFEHDSDGKDKCESDYWIILETDNTTSFGMVRN